MRSYTPVCSCQWDGFAVHAYNDDMISSLSHQARNHLHETQAVERYERLK